MLLELMFPYFFPEIAVFFVFVFFLANVHLPVIMWHYPVFYGYEQSSFSVTHYVDPIITNLILQMRTEAQRG